VRPPSIKVRTDQGGPPVAQTTDGSIEGRSTKWRKAMRLRVLLMGLAIATTTGVGANESISIRVSPAMSFAPANLVIRTTVEPDVDNRAMEIVADSEEFYRSSSVQLEGDRAPKTTMFEFRSLPPGEYRVTAVLFGANGQRRGTARAQIRVVESGISR
jgi:hypothetical protein